MAVSILMWGGGIEEKVSYMEKQQMKDHVLPLKTLCVDRSGCIKAYTIAFGMDPETQIYQLKETFLHNPDGHGKPILDLFGQPNAKKSSMDNNKESRHNLVSLIRFIKTYQ